MSSPSSPGGKDWDSLVAQVAWFGDGDDGSGETPTSSAVTRAHEQKAATPSSLHGGDGGGGGARPKSASSPSATSAPVRRRHSSSGIGITTLRKQHVNVNEGEIMQIMPQHSPVHSVAAPDMSQASQGIKIFLRVRPSLTPSGWFELDEHEGSIRCVRQRRRSCSAACAPTSA